MADAAPEATDVQSYAGSVEARAENETLLEAEEAEGSDEADDDVQHENEHEGEDDADEGHED